MKGSRPALTSWFARTQQRKFVKGEPGLWTGEHHSFVMYLSLVAISKGSIPAARMRLTTFPVGLGQPLASSFR